MHMYTVRIVWEKVRDLVYISVSFSTFVHFQDEGFDYNRKRARVR